MPLTGTAVAATGYSAQGVTNIRWGTTGLVGTYIVTRFSQRELVENIKLPNGTGITATRIQLKDGIQFDVTVREIDDATPPKIGDLVAVLDEAKLVSGARANYSARVVDNNYDIAPKKEGERHLVLEGLRLIEGPNV